MRLPPSAAASDLGHLNETSRPPASSFKKPISLPSALIKARLLTQCFCTTSDDGAAVDQRNENFTFIKFFVRLLPRIVFLLTLFQCFKVASLTLDEKR